MATAQTRATEKYRKNAGIVTKSFKIKKDLLDEFQKACEKAGVTQVKMITDFMRDFIEQINHPIDS